MTKTNKTKTSVATSEETNGDLDINISETLAAWNNNT